VYRTDDFRSRESIKGILYTVSISNAINDMKVAQATCWLSMERTAAITAEYKRTGVIYSNCVEIILVFCFVSVNQCRGHYCNGYSFNSLRPFCCQI